LPSAAKLLKLGLIGAFKDVNGSVDGPDQLTLIFRMLRQEIVDMKSIGRREATKAASAPTCNPLVTMDAP
jgi:hypothetical protein